MAGTYTCGSLASCRPNAARFAPGYEVDPIDQYITHCWHEHTNARLLWLYGEEGRAAREAATHADVAAWRALGTRRAA